MTRALASLLTAGALLLAACASAPQPGVLHSYLVELPASPLAAPLLKDTLTLNPVTVLAPYSGKSLVIRSGDVAYTLDPYHEWAAHPAAMWRNALDGWLRERQLFSRVLAAGGTLADCTLDVTVLEASVDRRPGAAPQAVVRMHFFLQRSGKSSIMLDRSYRATRPVLTLAPDDEVTALGAAAQVALQAFEQDLRSLPAS